MDQHGRLVEDSEGRSLVSRLTQCRLIYKQHNEPLADKLSTSPHNADFKHMSNELKQSFISQGLKPYAHAMRASDIDDEAWKKQKEQAKKQGDAQFNKYEKLATLGDHLTLAEDQCIKPPGSPDQVTQEIIVRYTEVGWQLWNMFAQKLFRSCADANFHPMMKITDREWAAEQQRIADLQNDQVRNRQLEILEEVRLLRQATLAKYQNQPHSFRRALMEATNTLRAFGGFYAVVFGSLDETTANVWNKVKRTHDDYGCVGLMDPRWHPELMERLRGLGKSKSTASSLNQANIDDFMYFLRHPNPSDAHVEKASRSHEKIWNVVDAQRTFTVHFQHLDMLRRGSMPHMKAQSNQVLIRQRFVPVASAFEFTDDAQAKNANMFLGARFSGLGSINLKRDDPLKTQLVQTAERTLDRRLRVMNNHKREAFEADFQFQIMLNYKGDMDEFADMTQAATRRNHWFGGLENKIFKLQETDVKLGKSDEFVDEAFAVALRRGLPYDLQQDRPMKLWGRTHRPSDAPKALEYIVEKQDVFLSTWAEKLKGRRLGCFIIDAPMGLHGDSAWSLNQVITLVKSIEQWCTPPYTIVLYSLHSMSDVQRALVEAESKSKGKQGKGLQVTRFIMVKDTMQEGRAGPGSNLYTHMFQDVLVIHPGSVILNLEAGSHPVRSFGPLSGAHNDELTSGGGFYLNNDGTKVNLSQKPLLQLEFLLRACHQGNWVVDMCCGSGSGLIAALRMGYSVAGFDTNKTQVEAARRRVASFAQQESKAVALDKEYLECFDEDEESAESNEDDQGDEDFQEH